MDDAVDMFTAFTGTTPEIARRYLGMTENNTEQAIQLFFDSPDLASGMDRPSQPLQPPQPRAPSIPRSTRPQQRSTSVGREDAQGVVHLDSDDEVEMDVDANDEQSAVRAAAAAAEIEDDEAMARRMQEELYAGGDSSGGYDADGVRAPIARTTETLVGGPDADYADDMHAQAMQQIRARQQYRSTGMDISTFQLRFGYIL